MSTTDRSLANRDTRKLIGLRANAFAAVVMLLLEFGLGMGVNLYASLPAADHGKGVFPGFGRAVAGGPVVLTLHALLGTLLLAAGVAVVVRAARIGRGRVTVLAGVALVAILVAWVSGTRFVGHVNNGASLGMALATAVALLCYVTILFLVSSPSGPVDAPGRESAN